MVVKEDAYFPMAFQPGDGVNGYRFHFITFRLINEAAREYL